MNNDIRAQRRYASCSASIDGLRLRESRNAKTCANHAMKFVVMRDLDRILP